MLGMFNVSNVCQLADQIAGHRTSYRENSYAKYVVVFREKLCFKRMRTWSTWP